MPMRMSGLRAQVAEAMSDGASLDEVEEQLIEPAPVSADLRDALWLYAWNLSEMPAQSREEAQRFVRE